MSHWISKYIGLKHVPGARGPTEVDCWGLLYLVYNEVFGISLPSMPGISQTSVLGQAGAAREASETQWVEVQAPFDGAAVAMSQKMAIHHVGLYTTADGGRIVHCQDKANVIADTIRGLKLKGFRTIKFYRHITWPT